MNTDNMKIFASDAASLKQILSDHEVQSYLAERKSAAADAQVLVIALGGGAGIATIISSLGNALKAYFEGRAELARAEKVKICIGELSLEASAKDLDQVMLEINKTRENKRLQ